MIEKALRLPTDLITVSGRIGIVDIGSNTVRLVVYDVPERMPVPMFNEKAECRLVEGMSRTGRLSPAGVKKALNSLRRFVRLSVAMGVEKLDLVATAAVRDASDGPAFAKMIETEFGIDVCILSGSEEAELSALGLVVGVPKADGILGDLGGGSLDLVGLERGQCMSYCTLPLGHLRLQEMADGNIDKAHTIIADHFAKSDWLRQSEGKNLYLTGGIMRAIARIFIEQTNYPLHVVDNFTIRADDALGLARLMAGLSRSSLTRISPLSPSRVKSIPYATEVLGSLIEIAKPSEVVFSGFGMREGQMLQHLPEEMRHQDPLIAGAETLAERTGRFSLNGAEVANWVSPLFPSSGDEDRRRILAACLLSDIGWNEHPDYRAEHSFYRALRLPFAGLSHADRVFIAATVFVRYNGDSNAKVVNDVRALLDPDLLAKVDGIGRAIRLAHTLSGSAPGLLSLTSLERADNKLILHLPGYSRVFQSETVNRRFRGLCKSLGLRGSISRS
ncbi:MAG: hypothetical protein WD075_06710 [Rhodospirillales bacterium]